jgi:hypothetical protein
MEFRSVGEVLTRAQVTADWTAVRALVEQSHHMPALPADLRGALAERLAGLAESYRGNEDGFVEDALALIADVADDEVFDADLFRRHYLSLPRSAEAETRLPGLFETIVETARRLRDARRLEEVLAGTRTSGILGGSTSYGPFHNVGSSSDLDVVVVIEGGADALSAIARLRGLAGASPASVEHACARAKLFNDRYDDGHTAFSHKIEMWDDAPDPRLTETTISGHYKLSLHLLTARLLGYALAESSARLDRETAGGRRTVRDYRDTTTSRADVLRSFTGREHREKPELTEAVEGWLRTTTAYRFDQSGSYCPGFLQTLLLPLIDLRWDELECRRDLRVFERKFFERYRTEKRLSPHHLVFPSYSHPRQIFAPHVTREFNRDR